MALRAKTVFLTWWQFPEVHLLPPAHLISSLSFTPDSTLQCAKHTQGLWPCMATFSAGEKTPRCPPGPGAGIASSWKASPFSGGAGCLLWCPQNLVGLQNSPNHSLTPQLSPPQPGHLHKQRIPAGVPTTHPGARRDSQSANPIDPARQDLGWGQGCTPIHAPETGRPATDGHLDYGQQSLWSLDH